MTTAITWAPSIEVEGWLNRIIPNERWAYIPDLPLALIDKKASLQAQNRSGVQLDRDHVYGISVSLRAGQPVPPLVVRRVGPSRFVMVDGNHRHAGAESVGITSAAAYVVDVDDSTFYLMSAAANATNGKEAGAEHLLRAAVYAVKVKGLPTNRVAPLFGMSETNLGDHIRAAEGRDKLRNAGLDPSKVALKKATFINRLDQDQVTYLAPLLADPKVSADDTRAVVNAILAKPAASQQAETARQRIQLESKLDNKQKVANAPRRKTAVTGAMRALTLCKRADLSAALTQSDDEDRAVLLAAMVEVGDAISRTIAQARNA